MSEKLESLLARVQSGESLVDKGYHNNEAFLITGEKLFVYSQDGWQYEFLRDEIEWGVLEVSSGNFLEIVDLTDPSARVYHFPDLYEIHARIIKTLEQS